jgi:putative oxidoreductase
MRDIGLLILRLAMGGTMLVHGLPKMMNFAEYSTKFPDPIGLGSQISLILAIFAEVFCALLVIIGFKTRYVVVPLIITMLVAFFIVHGADPFREKELAFLYLLGYISIAFTGAGKYSVDRN